MDSLTCVDAFIPLRIILFRQHTNKNNGGWEWSWGGTLLLLTIFKLRSVLLIKQNVFFVYFIANIIIIQTVNVFILLNVNFEMIHKSKNRSFAILFFIAVTDI